jgi:hypothetical protein
MSVRGPSTAPRPKVLRNSAFSAVSRPSASSNASSSGCCCRRRGSCGEIGIGVAKADHQLAVELSAVAEETVGVDHFGAVRSIEHIHEVRHGGVARVAIGNAGHVGGTPETAGDELAQIGDLPQLEWNPTGHEGAVEQ